MANGLWKMKWEHLQSIEPLIFRWLVGGIFVFAGSLKALDPAEFARDIANYHLLPWTFVVLLALFLPWVEILAGVGLVLGWNRSGALRILLCLMLIFIQALLVAWARGLNIHCGCFGTLFATSNYVLLLLRDLVIFGVLVRLLLLEWKERIALEEPASPAPTGDA